MHATSRAVFTLRSALGLFAVSLLLLAAAGIAGLSGSLVAQSNPPTVDPAGGVVIPVGAVVPFFLTPEEIDQLKPNWLPADGLVVDDPQSPLNGRELPDLIDRFVMGADQKADLSLKDANTVGGTYDFKTGNGLFGTTGGAEGVNGSLRPVGEAFPPEYVVDTDTIETKHSDHFHSVFVSAGTVLGQTSPPPHRRLAYLVRVR